MYVSFNRSFLESTKGHRIAIAIDPCYISKYEKKTPHRMVSKDAQPQLQAVGIKLQDYSCRCILLERELWVRSEASLTSVNIARAFAHLQGMVLSVGSTKTLLHNAAMLSRFIAMSGKSPNMRLKNTDFNELLFYVVRAAV